MYRVVFLTRIVLFQAQIGDKTSFLRRKAIDLEDRNRRNNIRIDGIEDSSQETWSQTTEKVKSFIRNELKINDVVEIDRSHRVSTKNNLSKTKKPRTIVCKLLRFTDKEKILSKRSLLYNTGIYLNEDFSEETSALRKDLFNQAKIIRENGKYAKVSYNRLIVRVHKNSNVLIALF